MGLGLGTQAKPCLRIVSAMFLIAFLSVFYFFSDVTTDSYIELIRKTADFDTDFDYGGTTGCKYTPVKTNILFTYDIKNSL